MVSESGNRESKSNSGVESESVSGSKSRYSDNVCMRAAKDLTRYWESNPSDHFISITYDPARRLFVLKHKKDGNVYITVDRFFELVCERTMELIREQIDRLYKS